MSRVYFIKPVGLAGPVKIGVASCPEHRRKTLERNSPIRLEILATIAGDTTLEKRFHARFYGDHDRYEWFNTTPALLGVIDAINAETFAIDSLPEPRLLPRKVKDTSYMTAEWRAERSRACKQRHAEHGKLTISPAARNYLKSNHRASTEQPQERAA